MIIVPTRMVSDCSSNGPFLPVVSVCAKPVMLTINPTNASAFFILFSCFFSCFFRVLFVLFGRWLKDIRIGHPVDHAGSFAEYASQRTLVIVFLFIIRGIGLG